MTGVQTCALPISGGSGADATFQTTFSITGTVAITESGLFNDASVGSMLARVVFAALNLVNGDSVQITWTVTVS